MGMEAFAHRAERELLRTGERVRKRVVETRGDLTAQEAQIARLARDGLSNPEIGAGLFISPGPSNITSTRSSPSSTSRRAANSTECWRQSQSPQFAPTPDGAPVSVPFDARRTNTYSPWSRNG
jgi:hypothetical protein